MDDKHKTKAQLISELETLRRRVAQRDEAVEQQPNLHPTFLTWTDRTKSTIFIWQDSAFRYTNPAMSRLTGYDSQELIGRDVWSLIHPEFRELIRERVEAWQRGDSVPDRSEFKILTKSGETRWISADSTFIQFDGTPAALTIAFDSTAHKLAEEALNASKERYRNIVETAQEGIWMVDAEAKTTYSNHHLAEMLGYTRDEMIGRSVFDFVDEAAQEETRWRLERGTQSKAHHDFRFVRKDGSDLWAIVSTTPLFDDGGRFVGGLAMLVDVTERHLAEAALRESEARFRTLVGSMDDIVATIDKQHRYSEFFGRCHERFNLKPEAFIGRTPSEIWGKRTGLVHEEAMKRALSGEQVVFEWSPPISQKKIFFQTCLSPIRDKSGEVTSLVAVARDITERKRAEESIRFQANLLDQVEQAVIATDRDGNITYWNRFAERLYGWAAVDAIGRSIMQVTPAQTTREQAFEILRHLKEGNSWSGEFLVQRRDNTPFTVMVTDSPIYDDTGTLVGIVGVSSDITERKRAEEALRASEERYRDLVENARDIIYSHDLNGNYTSVNKAVEQITGYTCEEALKLTFEQVVTPEYIETVRQMISGKLAGEEETVYDLEILAKDGRRLTVEVNTRLIFQDDAPIGIHGIARDVTERKRAQEALRDSEERFRRFFELGLIGMVIASPSKAFIEVNDKMCELLGYERAELLQLTWAELTHPDDLPANITNFNRALAGEIDSYSLDKRFIKKDGGVIHATISVSCVRRADHSVDYFIALWQDVTERKHAEQALRKSESNLQAILDNCPALIFQKDLDGRYLQVNRQFSRFDLTPEQVVGRTDDELFPPELAAAFRATDRSVLDAGCSQEFEESAVYEDGLHSYIVQKFPLLDAAGNVYAVGGISTDITERKRAEDDLRRQKEILEKTFDKVPVMIRILDGEGRVKLVNREWERTLGWSLEEITSRGLDLFAELYPDPEYRKYVLKLIAASTGEFTEVKPTAKDGRVIDTTFANVSLEDGTNIGIGRDITERVRAEEALQLSAKKYRNLVEMTHDLVWSVDTDGRITYMSPASRRFYGREPEEMVGRLHTDFLPPDEAIRSMATLRNVLVTGDSTSEYEVRVWHKDGSEVILLANAAVLRDDAGNMVGTAGTSQNITERRRAEEARRQQADQLSALHEIEREISAESDLSRILEVVTRRASELLRCYHSSVYICDSEGTGLTLVASLDSELIGLRLREGEGLAGRVVQTGRAQSVDDYRQWEGRRLTLDTKGFGPVLCAPLKWQQTVLGAINLSRGQGEQRFTDEDSRLLEQLAAEAAIAIHQATLFDEVQESQKRLQILSRRLIDAQEAERKRLSRELHDQIGQALTAVQISLQILQSSSEGTSAGLLDVCLTIIDSAIQQVHDLSLDLRPSLLDDLGLAAALRWYVDRAASLAGLVTRFEAVVLETRIAPEVETACFRIAQEALTNVLRHAHAETVWVQVTQRDSGLQLVVRDDGEGFDVRAAMGRTGVNASLGLQGMQERAAALGGYVEIKSQNGNGVEILASFPLSQAPST